ncbi:MAG: YaaC family protein [Actinomycetota bacterium]
MTPRDAWLHLRNTLAHPPGAAAVTDHRQSDLYVSCIQQFEQLVAAAGAIAAHARPLPLYYAAMHAAKALAAAFGSTHNPRGHGLKQGSRPVPPDVMEFKIKPDDSSSVLSVLCEVTDSGVIEQPVRLGDLFLSLPDLGEKPHDVHGPCAFYVEEVPEDLSLYPVTDPILHVLIETRGRQPEAQGSTYPTLKGWFNETAGGGLINSRRQLAPRFGREVEFTNRSAALQDLAPTYRFSGERWLIPKVEGSSDVLSPLVTWYALLFGFSILARYEPDTWLHALDIRQRHAVAIEAALEEAAAALPELVWKHIATKVAEAGLAAE